MTSAKSYINWIKEAGRGHLTAVLTWGCYGILAGMMMLRLQVELLYTFFGIGNNDILYIVCSGLGTAVGFLEFSYLLQERKQDFYFSLPVKKQTIFWSRYVHGLFHGLTPMVCYMLICGIYQSSIDSLFMKYSVGYTFRSILAYAMVYLMFYHIVLFAVNACGRLLSAACMVGAVHGYFYLLLKGVCPVFAERFYETFFRSPLLETLQTRLIPWQLGYVLCGNTVHDKFEILEYRLPLGELLSAAAWIAVFGLLGAGIQRRRKAENVGRIFISRKVERRTEIAACAAAAAVLCVLAGNLGRYDSWLPEEGEVESLAVALYGIDMEKDVYQDLVAGRDRDSVEQYLEQFELKAEGRDEGMEWLRKLRGDKEEAFSYVTVCFGLKNGSRAYRTYPVSEEMFLAFSKVYESEEYRRIADPLLEADTELVEGARFTWYDGVSEQVLSLSEEEKKAFLGLYQEEAGKLTMADLETALPTGEIEIRSEVYGRSEKMEIYPFYEKCCGFLAEHGANPDKTLFDYPVQAVTVTEWISGASDAYSAGTAIHRDRYETAEEIGQWRDLLVLEEFCRQPLLYPVDTSGEVEVEVTEPESGAVITVECYPKQSLER